MLDCENNVNKMIEASSSEHLQPMKEKMEEFISQAQKSLDEVIKKLSSTQELFNKVSPLIPYRINLMGSKLTKFHN